MGFQMLEEGVSEDEGTAEHDRLTGVASSSRRRLSAEQDSRIGRTKSYEALSPRLTIPTRAKVELVKHSLHSSAHHRHGQPQLAGLV
jgi:hypothetical protein